MLFHSLQLVGSLLAVSSAYIIPPNGGAIKRDIPMGRPISSDVLEAAAGIHKRAPMASPAADIPVLHPINLNAFESATGVRRRADVDLSRLDPQTQAQLVYGTDGANGNILLANMTLHAPDGKPILLMEAFEGMTSAVDCNGDDGKLSITFTQKELFDAALERWSFIQENDDTQFILITNHDGCGPDDERQAYIVTDVDNDEVQFITHLDATTVAWGDITGTFDLEFGKAMLAPGAPAKLRTRGLLDSITDAFDDAVDGVTGVVDDAVDGVTDVVDDVTDVIDDATDLSLVNEHAEAPFVVSMGQENNPIQIYQDDMVKVDCSNCFISGTFNVAGTIRVSVGNIEELSIKASPQDFKSALEVTTQVTLQQTPLPLLTQSFTLFEAPVPGAGIVIPKIFTLGAVVGVDAGFSLTVSETITFTLGMQTQLPGTASLFIDMANLGDSSSTGFDNVAVTPVGKFDSGAATITGEVFLKPRISFKAEVIAIGKAEAAITMNVPKVTATGSMEYNAAGVCPDNTAQQGLKLGVSATMDIDVNVTADILGLIKSNLFSKNLLSISIFQQDMCFPFGGEAVVAPVPDPSIINVPSQGIGMPPFIPRISIIPGTEKKTT